MERELCWVPLIPPLFAGCRDSDKNATLCTDFIFPTHSMLDTQATCVSVSKDNIAPVFNLFVWRKEKHDKINTADLTFEPERQDLIIFLKNNEDVKMIVVRMMRKFAMGRMQKKQEHHL